MGITPTVQEEIRKFLMEKSTVASNRLVINKEQHPHRLQSVRYLEDSMKELYKQFQPNSGKKPVYQTFIKYANKMGVFRKPQRLTDLCEYCEKLIQVRKTIVTELRALKYETNEYEDKLNLKHICEFLERKQFNSETLGTTNDSIDRFRVI